MLEVVLTGAASAVNGGDRAATARTYLWMHPIYGAGGMLLEALSARVKRWPRPARWLSYLPVIYAVEYTSGWLLRRVLGRCPWDYERRGWNLSGLVRLDYAPLWLVAAGLFEPVRNSLVGGAARGRRATGRPA